VPKKADAAQKPLPASESTPPLVLTVGESGEVRVNKQLLTRAELLERLPRMLAAASSKVVYFDAADTAAYGSAVEVMDLARGGGARSIAILTEKVVE